MDVRLRTTSAWGTPNWQLLRAAHRPELRPALRVGFGLAIPGIVLLILGHGELMVYAVFGSVVGMYGRNPNRLQRLKDQALAAAMMLAAGISAIFIAPWHLAPWPFLAAGIMVALCSSLCSDRFGLKPGGSFFPLFAFGALGSLPVGEQLATSGLAAFVLTAMFSIVLGQTTRFVGSERRNTGRGLPWQEILRRAGCYGCVVLLAGSIAMLLGVDHLAWVMASAVVPLAAGNARGRLSRGAHRVAGTVAGLLVLLGIYSLQLPEVWLGLAVIFLMFPTEGYMTRNYGLALSFFTPQIMLMLELADPSVDASVMLERALANLLGVSAGILGALFFDPKQR
ncbi:hypothetical protein CQ017_03675 [Arthrobacter sp. MYb224]|uniref:FUSC family protein n=1 Tax=Arthrobacter sp. MYb224 TaxID=1848600 RepID=UPI000CFA86B3|nr:FUSC family protein [Arthrobacter sp. MYb224]PRA00147.1 hypothetical protein CQ017_03675 [Arthrobacter sp. MYb224]